jgi:hypothetical protein
MATSVCWHSLSDRSRVSGVKAIGSTFYWLNLAMWCSCGIHLLHCMEFAQTFLWMKTRDMTSLVGSNDVGVFLECVRTPLLLPSSCYYYYYYLLGVDTVACTYFVDRFLPFSVIIWLCVSLIVY